MNWKTAGVHLRLIAGLMIVSLCGVQTAAAAGQQVQAPPPPTISVPAGTLVPLTLVSPIKSKSTKVGDVVRAVVAFPITAAGQVAIPAGTYVEGVVTSLTAREKKTRQPDVQIHFTRLLYANGYTVALDAAKTQARNDAPGGGSPEFLSDNVGANGAGVGIGASRARIAFYGGEGFASRAQTSQPTLAPLAPIGPSKALIFGIAAGVTAAIVTLAIVFGHRGSKADYALFDAGWQFQMTLTSPLGVDAGQVAAAAATPSH
jgi:hypothetical protein